VRAFRTLGPDDPEELSVRIRWFKLSFQSEVVPILQGTPFTVDLLAAVALHETGYIWGPLVRKGWPTEKILSSCVGDTLDFPRRSKTAFPKNKQELITAHKGVEMFTVAREALETLGEHNSAFRRVAQKYPDKFCHGFGIFQYDLQYFLINPGFFLEKRWSDFGECVKLFVKEELAAAQKRAGFGEKKSLTNEELVFVAIAYNRGRVEYQRGLKQGHKNPATGKYYGEYISEYLKLSERVELGKPGII
jgi:hypothetical protein